MASQRTINAKSTTAKASSPSVSVEEGVCKLCYHDTKEWAVGQCDHPTCLRCWTKLRLLCGQKECPVCRLSLKKVLLVLQVKPYAFFVNVHRWRCDKKNSVFFQNQSIQDTYYSLMENKCSKCSEHPFRSFKLLRDHMNRSHDLHYCEICVDNLKLFPSEFKTYTRRELTVHRREGDKDDSSHKGHPLCQFCGERYLDNDQLHAHLRKNHFWCHFCESDGKQDYFCDYPLLRKHFRNEHFLCEEGPCKNEKFTSVFRSKIDLQAHRASAHSKGLSKAEAKQLRQVDVGFSYNRERDEEESAPVRRPRYTASRGGDYANRGGRGGPGRSREPPEQSRPKLVADPPKPKKSNSPPPLAVKTSPDEETKAPPPGFLTQPTQPPLTSSAMGTTPLAQLSSGQGYNWSSFDPYGDVSKTSETPHLVLSGNLFTTNIQQPTCRSELSLSTMNPPPGFSLSHMEETKTTTDVTDEWPDLTGGVVPSVTMFPPSISRQPVLGNITAAVMNANQNREPNLQSESSFPSLGSVPVSTSSDRTWMFSLESITNPPRSEQSKLLKFAVAATNSSSSTSSLSGSTSSKSIPAAYQSVPPQMSGVLDFSSQNFPPMTSAPLFVGGASEVPGGANQNDFSTESTSTESSIRRSKQSQLIEKVRKSLDYDRDKFTRFKTLMGWYKNGEVSVEEFKAQCTVLFGRNQWIEIGPELAEMMPNQEKKNELLSSFGVCSGIAKSVVSSTTSSAKSRKRVPASVPSVWGTRPVAPVRTNNYNAMSSARLSHEEYPTLGSARQQPKPLAQSTPWNVVIQ